MNEVNRWLTLVIGLWLEQEWGTRWTLRRGWVLVANSTNWATQHNFYQPTTSSRSAPVPISCPAVITTSFAYSKNRYNELCVNYWHRKCEFCRAPADERGPGLVTVTTRGGHGRSPTIATPRPHKAAFQYLSTLIGPLSVSDLSLSFSLWCTPALFTVAMTTHSNLKR